MPENQGAAHHTDVDALFEVLDAEDGHRNDPLTNRPQNPVVFAYFRSGPVDNEADHEIS